MGFPDRFAAAIIRLRFRSIEKPQLTRKECAAFGALLYFGCAAMSLLLYVIAWRMQEKPSPEWTPWPHAKEMPVFGTISMFLALAPPMAVFGALAGLTRYQMKCGTEEERAGGGSGFQILMALPLALIYFPLAIAGLPLLLIDRVAGTALWGNGTSGWIAVLGAVLTALAAFTAASAAEAIGDAPAIGFILASLFSADPLLSWLIFRWHALGFLAAPGQATLPWRFSLASLVLAILGLGAYLSLLVLLFGF